MEHGRSLRSRSLLWAATACLAASIMTGGTKTAAAQSADAADLCTPDVMRLCSEFVPDADRIVGCLKAKRRQLSPRCLAALSPAKSTGSNKSSASSKSSTSKKKQTKRTNRN
jgi:hypothetical protein